MLKVILFEDNKKQREEYENFLRHLILLSGYEAEVVLATDSKDEILKYVNVNSKEHDFLFILDIEINEDRLAGFHLAKEIRKDYPFEPIIFLTSHDQLSMMAIERRISPIDFIVKNIDYDKVNRRLREDLEYCLKILSRKKSVDFFTYKKRNRYYKLKFSDIYYFETIPGKPNIVTMHCKDRVVDIRGTLNQIEIDHKDFFRSHKSYLINKENYKKIDYQKKIIYFDVDEEIGCPVSTRKLRELKSLS